MALIQVNYLSRELFRTVPLNVILPVDKLSFETMDYAMKDGQKFKTLYLLHGLLGNYTDWVSGTRIQRWAEEKNLAVVMPSGDNAFYVDQHTPNNHYDRFINEELIKVTRRMFPLSGKREDTYIAGLSMGGYGAIVNAANHNDVFGCCAGLSSGIHIMEEGAHHVAGEHLIFNEDDLSSNKNPRVAITELRRRLDTNPSEPEVKFYLACGTSDHLIEPNRRFHEFMVEQGMDVTYVEAPGAHEWDFWDSQIRKVLDWLPLEERTSGVTSGSVAKDE